jgi:hypothetical protein
MGAVQDGLNSAIRYYRNNLMDGYRQVGVCGVAAPATVFGDANMGAVAGCDRSAVGQLPRAAGGCVAVCDQR